jgi:hypothetical protein
MSSLVSSLGAPERTTVAALVVLGCREGSGVTRCRCGMDAKAAVGRRVSGAEARPPISPHKIGCNIWAKASIPPARRGDYETACMGARRDPAAYYLGKSRDRRCVRSLRRPEQCVEMSCARALRCEVGSVHGQSLNLFTPRSEHGSPPPQPHGTLRDREVPLSRSADRLSSCQRSSDPPSLADCGAQRPLLVATPTTGAPSGGSRSTKRPPR